MRQYGKEAADSLSVEDLDFIKKLPKAELHAHLNGCIPLQTLRDLALRFPNQMASTTLNEDIVAKLKILDSRGIANWDSISAGAVSRGRVAWT